MYLFPLQHPNPVQFVSNLFLPGGFELAKYADSKVTICIYICICKNCVFLLCPKFRNTTKNIWKSSTFPRHLMCIFYLFPRHLMCITHSLFLPSFNYPSSACFARSLPNSTTSHHFIVAIILLDILIVRDWFFFHFHYQAFSLVENKNVKTQCDVKTSTAVYSCLSFDMQVRHFIYQHKTACMRLFELS